MTSIARPLHRRCIRFRLTGRPGSELYGSHIEASFQSTRTRAEVQLEAPRRSRSSKNYVVVESNATPSTVDRATVQARRLCRLRA